MNDLERRLEDAGERWRASQRPVPEVSPAMFVASRSRSNPVALLAAGAVGALLVLLVGAAAIQLDLRPGVGAQPIAPTDQPPTASPGPDVANACAVTRPIPEFIAPAPFPASPPAYYGAGWFGSAALWTMIDREGEIWPQGGLPHGPGGLGQKLFWWSADWRVADEPEPAITVVGTRLDGPGTFTSDRGTNATADFGTAMLVGGRFPTPGCWQLTGRFGDAVLSYVVWITDD
jgi:hypothetical protein